MLQQCTAELYERLTQDPLLQNWREGKSMVTVTGRTKSIHSTWKKLQRDDCSIDEILDLVALRIVLDPLDQADEASLCYHVLGKIHGLWTPLPRTLKDYISSPKPNGYRSLHTTVLVGAQPLEVQIRTQAMHQVAEFGRAAHWAYKDEANLSDASLPWVQVSTRAFSRSIAKWEEDVSCSHEFMQLVRQELLGTRVFVFTERGRTTRILNLARGATLADAAALLDCSLTEHACLLQGRVAEPTTALSNGCAMLPRPIHSPLARPV